MKRVTFGIVAGLAFGFIDVLLMIPLDMADKQTAMLAAFLNRCAIGFLIPVIDGELPGAARGMLVGLLISLPDAVITGAYAPIIVIGLVGGGIIGWAAGRWAVHP